MNETKLRVLLIDDELDPDTDDKEAYLELRRLVEIVESTDLIMVEVRFSYQGLGDTDAQVRETIKDYDLLILDVLTRNRDPKPFIEALNIIGRERPFLAYTQLALDSDIHLPGGYLSLRDLVYRMGGLGIIEKPSSPHESARASVYSQVVERILWYYWCTR